MNNNPDNFENIFDNIDQLFDIFRFEKLIGFQYDAVIVGALKDRIIDLRKQQLQIQNKLEYSQKMAETVFQQNCLYQQVQTQLALLSSYENEKENLLKSGIYAIKKNIERILLHDDNITKYIYLKLIKRCINKNKITPKFFTEIQNKEYAENVLNLLDEKTLQTQSSLTEQDLQDLKFLYGKLTLIKEAELKLNQQDIRINEFKNAKITIDNKMSELKNNINVFESRIEELKKSKKASFDPAYLSKIKQYRIFFVFLLIIDVLFFIIVTHQADISDILFKLKFIVFFVGVVFFVIILYCNSNLEPAKLMEILSENKNNDFRDLNSIEKNIEFLNKEETSFDEKLRQLNKELILTRESIQQEKEDLWPFLNLYPKLNSLIKMRITSPTDHEFFHQPINKKNDDCDKFNQEGWGIFTD